MVQFCFSLDRDLQCDFDTEFWEESDCGWRFNFSMSKLFMPGTDTYKLVREKVNTNDTGYWKVNNRSGHNLFHDKHSTTEGK